MSTVAAQISTVTASLLSVPIHAKSPYVCGHHHTGTVPHTSMLIIFRHRTSIGKQWAPYRYGQVIIPLWASDLKNPYEKGPYAQSFLKLKTICLQIPWTKLFLQMVTVDKKTDAYGYRGLKTIHVWLLLTYGYRGLNFVYGYRGLKIIRLWLPSTKNHTRLFTV